MAACRIDDRSAMDQFVRALRAVGAGQIGSLRRLAEDAMCIALEQQRHPEDEKNKSDEYPVSVWRARHPVRKRALNLANWHASMTVTDGDSWSDLGRAESSPPYWWETVSYWALVSAIDAVMSTPRVKAMPCWSRRARPVAICSRSPARSRSLFPSCLVARDLSPPALQTR
jgi:hypothetical protein